MMRRLVNKIVFSGAVLSVLVLHSCKDKDPSVAKIYVRSASNELLADASVVIIADIDGNESTQEYVDTLITNGSGFVEFNLSDYYSKIDKNIKVAKFDIISRRSNAEGFGTIRTRINTTAVETVKLIK